MAFKKVTVSTFFGLLGELYDQHKFTADRIYNRDESGISAVSKNTSMLVYPRQHMKPELLNNCSPGMWAECHVSSWMQKEIFEK